MAPWRSGYVGLCKSSYTGSNPVGASIIVTYVRQHISTELHYRTKVTRTFTTNGRVAELVYAVDLKSAGFTTLRVRVPPRPPTKKTGSTTETLMIAGLF